MAEFSRVKKYEELRKEIETDQKGTLSGGESKKFDPRIEALKEERYTPTHEKVFEPTTGKTNENNSSSFKNEYLDSFIQEVRDYNIQKGIRESEDTKLDILQQLTTKNRERRSNYIEKIEDENTLDNVLSNDNVINTNMRNEETLEISRQVFDLLNDDVAPEVVATEAEPKVEVNDEVAHTEPVLETPILEAMDEAPQEEVTMSLDERIAFLEEELGQARVDDVVPVENYQENEKEEEELSEITKRELLDQTKQLKIKMDQYEDELSEINSGVDSNNRLLNIVITVLILALLCVIGVVVYWLISGGIL